MRPYRVAVFDLETTTTKPETAEVVQVACLILANGAEEDSGKVLCKPQAPIPDDAAAIHGITNAMVADAEPFPAMLPEFVEALESVDALVTFNGTGYDQPIIERYLRRRLRNKVHVDVMRLWWRLRAEPLRNEQGILARDFAGTLGGAYAWTFGVGLDGAHDAMIDVRATWDVVCTWRTRSPSPYAGCSFEQLAEICNQPMPGFADRDGKLKWQGADLVFAFGKHQGMSLRAPEAPGYMRWMLGQDFPADTKDILRQILAGNFPTPPSSATAIAA